MHFATKLTLLALLAVLPSLTEAQQPLYESEDLLEITLSGEISELFSDRSDDAIYHPIQLRYRDANENEVIIDLKAKTRGNFRRKRSNCTYPPILLNFDPEDDRTSNSLFRGQDKMKLIMPCRDDKYVPREYMMYKFYNLFTPYSFNARLIRITIKSEGKKKVDPMYGVLLEDEDMMAARNSMLISKRNGLKPQMLDRPSMQRTAVFEYFIGNTDWSVQYRHNIKLLSPNPNSLPIPVPYDFDHAGMVGAPYAKPSPALRMKSVKERRYRGHCQPEPESFRNTFKEFNDKREELSKVILGQSDYLDEKYVSWINNYIDDFYEIINDPRKSASAFSYPCRPGGTGNVVIKGLREVK